MTLPNGAVYSVEVPQTKEGRERGLMFRPRLEPKTGMLFVFPALDRHLIWMKNCRRRKMLSAPPPNQAGIIKGAKVFSQPSL